MLAGGGGAPTLATTWAHLTQKKKKVESPLTHPDLSEAALTQFELQLQRLPGNLPRILGQPLSLRLDRGTHRRQPVAQSVGVLCRCGG